MQATDDAQKLNRHKDQTDIAETAACKFGVQYQSHIIYKRFALIQ